MANSSKRRWRRVAGLLLAIALGAFAYAKIDQLPIALAPNTGSLAQYRHVKTLPLPNPIRAASGLAYYPSHDSLLLLSNRPAALYELSKQGDLLRTIDLKDFDDTEGVAWIEGNQFIVCEERVGKLVYITLKEADTVIERKSCREVRILPHRAGNRGLEGVAYDPVNQEILAAKQSDPRRVFARPSCELDLARDDDPWPLGLDSWLTARRISDLHFDPATDHLFVLSRQSQAITEFGRGGRVAGRFWLKARSAGLSKALWRAEGMTMDQQRILYICEEPNLLNIFHT